MLGSRLLSVKKIETENASLQLPTLSADRQLTAD
jgi:hypothetical protein